MGRDDNIKVEDYVHNRLSNFAKIHNIDDDEEVEFWYSTFCSAVRDEMRNRIKLGDSNKLFIEESISTMEDILSRKYG
jgi:hypothetical protein